MNSQHFDFNFLHTQRISECTLMARLLYPYFISMTNFFGRLEDDNRVIHRNLNNSLFGLEITVPDVGAFLKEYEDKGLCFRYPSGGRDFIQFIARPWTKKEKPKSMDKSIPAPPRKEFQAWAENLHGANWWKFSPDHRDNHLFFIRSQAGKKGGRPRRITSSVNEQTGLSKSSNLLSSTNSSAIKLINSVSSCSLVSLDPLESSVNVLSPTSKENQKPRLPLPSHFALRDTRVESKELAPQPNFEKWPDFIDEWSPAHFAYAWVFLVVRNPHWKPCFPDMGKLEAEFKEILTNLDAHELHLLFAFTQTPDQAKYNCTTTNLVKNWKGTLVYAQRYAEKNGWLELYTTELMAAVSLPEEELLRKLSTKKPELKAKAVGKAD